MSLCNNKDLLPDIFQQLGPKQHKLLQELVANLPQSAEDVPNLVEAPTITPPKFGFC
jgi:hypothetical protein